MLNKLLTSLLALFYKVDKERPLSVKGLTPHTEIVPKAEYILNNDTGPSVVVKVTPKARKIKNKVTKADRNIIIIQIQTNIYFLDTLIEEFKMFPNYDSYLYKLEDLKKQSEGCMKIIFKIKIEAPYYAHTLKTIYSHAKNIAELMEE